jgi:hypothetical protein
LETQSDGLIQGIRGELNELLPADRLQGRADRKGP